MRNLIALGLCLLFTGQGVSSSWAAAGGEDDTPAQVGYGVGSALGTFVYAPLKGTFCILGAVGSVFALPFDTATSEKMVGTTCRGTWVITPDVLKGREQVQFIGHPPARDKAPKQ